MEAKMIQGMLTGQVMKVVGKEAFTGLGTAVRDRGYCLPSVRRSNNFGNGTDRSGL